jgi:hypothetical protein
MNFMLTRKNLPQLLHLTLHSWSFYFPCSYLLVISEQGLLQSEPEGERNENVGFYGRCMDHANDFSSRINPKECLRSSSWTCARTEVILL